MGLENCCINKPKLQHHKYILTTIYYFTWLNKVAPLLKVNEAVAIQFLEQHLVIGFGVPSTLLFGNATYFSSLKLTKISLYNRLALCYSSNYYP